MESHNYFDLDTHKLLSLEGQTWSHFDYGLDEDSSNDIEDGKSDTSSTIIPTTNGGINYNSLGVSDTMKLKEEDMYLFGLCPAYDPFFLAVCEYCGQVIKPQALAKHIELRHRSFPNESIHGKPDNLSHDQLDERCNAQSTLNLIPGMKGIGHRVGSNGDTNRLGDNMNTHPIVSGRSTLFSSDNNKNDSNKHILLEAIPPGSSSSSPLSFGQPNNQIIGSGLPGTSHMKNLSSQPNQSGINSPFNNIAALSSSSSSASSPNSSNSSQTLVGSNNLSNTRYGSSQLNAIKTESVGSGNMVGSNGAKTKSSNNLLVKKASIRGKLLPCKDREYDADKHCGVKIGDMDKPCTRSLTCKTHSLTLRRSVIDRSKNFDDLLADHRATKEAALRAAGIEVKPTKQQLKQRELEAKRQLLLQQTKPQQQQSHQPQQKQQKQQHGALLQQKLDQSNSHQSKSQPKYNTHHQAQQQSHHHLRHHSNHSLELPISSNHSHHSQHQQPQQLKEINSTASQSTNQLIIGKQDKYSPILARQLNETIDSKIDSKNSVPSTIQQQQQQQLSPPPPTPTPPTLPTVPSTSSPIPTPFPSNQLDKANFIEVDGCLYLPNPPKPMALCNFNARQISIEPLNCDQDDNPCNLSSRLFTRKRDLTYSALTIFKARSKADGRPNNQKLLSLLNSN